MKNVKKKKYEKQKWWIYIVQLVDLGLLKKSKSDMQNICRGAKMHTHNIHNHNV